MDPTFLKNTVSLWLNLAEVAEDQADVQWRNSVREIKRYLGKSYMPLPSELLATGYGSGSPELPLERVTHLNKTREYMQIMVPYIHEKVPNRLVAPRHVAISPAMREFAGDRPRQNTVIASDELMSVLNYTADAFGLASSTRKVAYDFLSTGRGVWRHVRSETSSGEFVTSQYENSMNVIFDPDATSIEDAGYIMLFRRESVVNFANYWGLDPDEVRGNASSQLNRVSSSDFNNLRTHDRHMGENSRETQENYDVIEYYEVFSRIGLGHKLKGASDEVKVVASAMEDLDDHVYLCIADGYDWPVNLPPPTVIDPELHEEIKLRLAWPVELFGDTENPWPFSFVDAIPGEDNPYPVPPLEAAMPLQVFMDLAYAWTMERGKTAGRVVGIGDESIPEVVQKGLVDGFDQEIIFAKMNNKDIKTLFQLVEFPAVPNGLPEILSLVKQAWVESTGLEPLMYGGGGMPQMRSAEEAAVRDAKVTSRPDDMAAEFQRAHSRVAAKEGAGLRLYTKPEAVAPIFEEPPINILEDGTVDAASVWHSPLTTAWAWFVNTNNPYLAASEFRYTIEAGHGLRRNKAQQIQNTQMLVNMLLPAFIQMISQGIAEPYNNLIQLLGKTYELPLETLMLGAPNANAVTGNPQAVPGNIPGGPGQATAPPQITGP
jgi:hypothetical protein